MAAPAPQMVALAIGGPLARADLPELCALAGRLIEQTGAEVALCDVTRAEPDAVTVDALARLRLAARNCGCRTRLRGASSQLLELLAFVGLGELLQDER